MTIAHPSLRRGDHCPGCTTGKIYPLAEPATLVRITGLPPLAPPSTSANAAVPPVRPGLHRPGARRRGHGEVRRHGRQHDRPVEVRQRPPVQPPRGLQRALRIPLPASTQWDIVHAAAPQLAPALEELIRQAAQGEVLHNDDTTVKILELMAEQRRAAAADERHRRADAACSPRASSPCATATGSRCSSAAAGTRARTWPRSLPSARPSLPPPIQMCDALAANTAGRLRTILANCLAHARRRFVDVFDRFPEECPAPARVLARGLSQRRRRARAGAVPRGAAALPPGRAGRRWQTCTTWLRQQLDEKRSSPIRPWAARSVTCSSTGSR